MAFVVIDISHRNYAAPRRESCPRIARCVFCENAKAGISKACGINKVHVEVEVAPCLVEIAKIPNVTDNEHPVIPLALDPLIETHCWREHQY